MKLHGKEYTEVKDRIPIFLTNHPFGSIASEVYWHNPDFSAVCVKATVTIPGEDTHPARTFTGFAYEERVEGATTEVNTTSWVENAETSAIGRALANMNIGVNGTRVSAEEMQKVGRMKAGARPAAAGAPPPPLPRIERPTELELKNWMTGLATAGDVDVLKSIWENVQGRIQLAGPEVVARFQGVKEARKIQLEGTVVTGPGIFDASGRVHNAIPPQPATAGLTDDQRASEDHYRSFIASTKLKKSLDGLFHAIEEEGRVGKLTTAQVHRLAALIGAKAAELRGVKAPAKPQPVAV